jgi:hypothetical protein
MSKPYIHAVSSAKKHGGKPEEYEKFHEWFDQTKSLLPDQRHRALLHSSFGIFLCTQVFGNTFTNSVGKVVSVRDIGEQHVLEDFGGRFIPTAQDYLQEIEYKSWMQNGKEYPPSFQKIDRKRKADKAEKSATPTIQVPKELVDLLNQLPNDVSAEDVVVDGNHSPSKLPGADVVWDGSNRNRPEPTID